MPYTSPYPEFEYTELIREAMAHLGIDWNAAHDLMDCFRVDAPEWSVRYCDYDLSEMDPSQLHGTEEAFAVMRKIFEKHNVETIRVLK